MGAPFQKSPWRFVLTILILLAGSAGTCLGQASPRTIDVLNLKVQDAYIDSARGTTGLRLGYELKMNWLPDSLADQRFALRFRLESNGDTVFQSAQIQKPDFSFQGIVQPPWAYMTYSLRSFLPYHYMDLETGTQTVDWVLTLVGRDTTYADFARVPLTFSYRKMWKRPVEDQVFQFSEFKTAPWSKVYEEPSVGTLISSKISVQYPLEESEDASYSIYWQVRDSIGKTVLFDSRESKLQHKFKDLKCPKYAGHATELSVLVPYSELQLNGTSWVRVQYYALGKTKMPMLVGEKDLYLEVPTKYNFKDQGFANVGTRAYVQRNAADAGIALDFVGEFAYNGFMRDSAMGGYHFYLQVMDESGHQVFDQSRVAAKDWWDQPYEQTISPNHHRNDFKGTIFIAYEWLKLTPGPHQLTCKLWVSDAHHAVKFPELGMDTLSIVKPPDIGFRVTLEKLDVQYGSQYDFALEPFSHGYPDLVYRLLVNGAPRFRSPEYSNAFHADRLSFPLWMTEPADLTFELHDIDWGYEDSINKNDELATLTIDYHSTADNFILERKGVGYLELLRLKFERLK